jgi:hypothetical protein
VPIPIARVRLNTSTSVVSANQFRREYREAEAKTDTLYNPRDQQTLTQAVRNLELQSGLQTLEVLTELVLLKRPSKVRVSGATRS